MSQRPVSRKDYNTIKKGWAKGERVMNILDKVDASYMTIYNIARTRNYRTYLNGRKEPNPSLWHRIFK